MDVAAGDRWSGEGDVDRLGLGEIREPGGLELRTTRTEGRLDRPLGLVRRLAQACLLRGRQRADAREELAQLAALAAEVLELDAGELISAPCLGDRVERLGGQARRV